MNKVFLIGHLGTEPEIKVTAAAQHPYCFFRLATDELRRSLHGGYEKRVEWHTVLVFGASALTCAKFLHKGAQVFVEGCLRATTYQDKSGSPCTATRVLASSVLFLGPRRANSTDGVEVEIRFEEDLDED